ncbi:MAG: SGNH/GDSL hydrolase family protein [Deltaproteobacteria bacterium]|nr:SGNH/GDSL hydrolase family protein [Deltaproteobacteria bacterium]
MRRFATKRGAIKAVVVFVGVLVALEIVLRVAGYGSLNHGLLPDGTPTDGHGYQPRNPYVDASFSIVTDNVVVVGDAWAFGLGCKYEDIFPSRLETRLKIRRAHARVVNLAHPDFTASDVSKNFGKDLKRYKADVAVVLVSLADGVPEFWKDEFFARTPFAASSRGGAGFRLGALLGDVRLARRVGSASWDPEAKGGYVRRVKTLAETQSALFDIGRVARDAKVPVVWITYPVAPARGWPHPHYPVYARNNDLIRATAVNDEQAVVDLEKEIPPDDIDRFILTWMPWPHPSPEGHERIASALDGAITPILDAR